MFRPTLSVWLAQLGGIGRSPVAPGTMATLAAGVPAAWLVGRLPWIWAVLILVSLFVIACYVSEMTERQLGLIDPNFIVIDELLGYLVTMIGFAPGLKSLAFGVVLFRFMDIYKPWPVNLLNRASPGGIWVVLDDVAAGCYAHLALWVVLTVWP